MVWPSAIIVQKWEEVIQPIIGTLLHNQQMTCKSEILQTLVQKISQPRHIPGLEYGSEHLATSYLQPVA